MLLMPWTLTSPSHHQPCYGLCRLDMSLFSTRKDYYYLFAIQARRNPGEECNELQLHIRITSNQFGTSIKGWYVIRFQYSIPKPNATTQWIWCNDNGITTSKRRCDVVLTWWFVTPYGPFEAQVSVYSVPSYQYILVHEVKITSLLCQNDVVASFWRNNDVIITPFFRWDDAIN